MYINKDAPYHPEKTISYDHTNGSKIFDEIKVHKILRMCLRTC